MCSACMYICVPHVVLVPSEARKGQWSSGNWSSRWLKPLHWSWEMNLGLLKEQPAHLDAEPSLQSPKTAFKMISTLSQKFDFCSFLLLYANYIPFCYSMHRWGEDINLLSLNIFQSLLRIISSCLMSLFNIVVLFSFSWLYHCYILGPES